MTRCPYDFIISPYSMTSLSQLQRTIAVKNEQIKILNSERNWLEADNNLQRVTVIRLKEKIAEYEKYVQSREAAIALELERIRQHAMEREEQIQKQQNEKILAITARYLHWKKAYYAKEEECNSMKRALDLGLAIFRFNAERSLQRASGPSRGDAVNIVYGGYIDCTTPLKQPTMCQSRFVSISGCTKASRGRIMGRLVLSAPEIASVSPVHPAGDINLDAASAAHLTGEIDSSQASPADSSTLREVTRSGSPSLEVLTSKIFSNATIPSCKVPLNPRTRQRELALPAPAAAVTPADLAEIYCSKASLKESIALGEGSRSGVFWIELSTLKISLCSDVSKCKTSSKASKRQRKLAIAAPEVDAVSPAHPAEEIEVIKVLPVPEVGAVSPAHPAEEIEVIKVLPAPEVGAVSPAHPAEEIEVIKALPAPEVGAVSPSHPVEEIELIKVLPAPEVGAASPAHPAEEIELMKVLPAPEIGAVSPAHPAEEIEVIKVLPALEVGAVSVSSPAKKTELIEATRTDDMALGDRNNFGDAMSGSRDNVSNFASNDHEQQLSEAKFSSAKKEVRSTLCKARE